MQSGLFKSHPGSPSLRHSSAPHTSFSELTGRAQQQPKMADIPVVSKGGTAAQVDLCSLVVLAPFMIDMHGKIGPQGP